MAGMDDYPPLPASKKGPVVVRGFEPQGLESNVNQNSVRGDRASTPLTVYRDTKVDDTVVSVRNEGDLVLEVSDENHPDVVVCCRVSRAILRQASPYFNALLHPSKFKEGIDAEKTIEELQTQHKSMRSIPNSELPKIAITSIGDTSQACRSNPATVITDSLRLLHRKWTNVAMVGPADLVGVMAASTFFGAFDLFRSTLARTENDGKALWTRAKAVDEVQLRQKLLVCIATGLKPNLFSTLSFRLATEGSSLRPKVQESDEWDSMVGCLELSNGVEDEITRRREAMLRVISLLQAFVLLEFRSNDSYGIRCRLGLENSYKCDIFQFGVAHRFFDRLKTLKISSSISPIAKIDKLDESLHEFDWFTGNILELVHSMKGAPDLQIDRNHTNCGIRLLLVPGLELIERMANAANVGLCLDCWSDRARRQSISWQGEPRLKSVRVNLRNYGTIHGQEYNGRQEHTAVPRCKLGGIHASQQNAKEFFTAEKIIWEY